MENGMKLSRRLFGWGLAVAAAMPVLGPSPASAEDVIKVERSPVGQFEALYIGERLGLFKERGIALDIKIGTSPDGALANVMSGERNVAVTGAVPLTAAVANGLPVVAVLNIQDQQSVATFGLVVPKDSPIKTIEDLKGKKIGMPGIASPQGSALLKTLEAHGMTRNDVELVNLPFPGVLQAVEAGSVDAGLPIGLFYDVAVEKGLRVFKEVFDNSTFGFPAVLYAASKEWADANKDALKRFNEAMALAYDYANKHQDEIREIDIKMTQMPPEYLKTRVIAPFVAGFNTAKWDEENAYLAKFGFISRAPQASEYLWSDAPRQ